MSEKKKKEDKKSIIIIIVAIVVIIIAAIVMIVVNKKDSSATGSSDEKTTTTTTSAFYSGTILSAGEDWIAEYTEGNITGCVYNNDRSGVYDNNKDYTCTDGTNCCTGDMETEYSYTMGQALGGGLDASGMKA